jgi:hypothetical protein
MRRGSEYEQANLARQHLAQTVVNVHTSEVEKLERRLSDNMQLRLSHVDIGRIFDAADGFAADNIVAHLPQKDIMRADILFAAVFGYAFGYESGRNCALQKYVFGRIFLGAAHI